MHMLVALKVEKFNLTFLKSAERLWQFVHTYLWQPQLEPAPLGRSQKLLRKFSERARRTFHQLKLIEFSS